MQRKSHDDGVLTLSRYTNYSMPANLRTEILEGDRYYVESEFKMELLVGLNSLPLTDGSFIHAFPGVKYDQLPFALVYIYTATNLPPSLQVRFYMQIWRQKLSLLFLRTLRIGT